MRKGEIIGNQVYWYVGDRRCEGKVVDIYVRDGGSSGLSLSSLREGARAVVIELPNGKRVVKLEDDVMTLNKQNFG
jgi:hypothetical protein